MADAASSHDRSREETDAILQEWCAALVDRLELDGVAIDVDALLGLAGQVAHAVVRPAAPLTAYVVGYAAGLAASAGTSESDAFAAAAALARDAARDFSPAS